MIGLALLVLLTHPHGAVDYVHGHKWFVIGAGAIAALGFALASGVMLMLRATGARRVEAGGSLTRSSSAGPASQR